MNRTLFPKEGIVAFSCGLSGKYIDDKNGSAEGLGLSKGAQSVFLFKKVLQAHPL